MSGADPATPSADSPVPDGRRTHSNLTLRVISAVILAPLAIGVAYVGDWFFIAFWFAAAALVLWEWMTVIGVRHAQLLFPAGFAGLAAVAILLARDRPVTALLSIVLGAFVVAVFAPLQRRTWGMAGLVYTGLLLLAPVLLRSDEQYGFAAILFLFAVVWTTDVLGYFVGRAFGGPKLAPSISPKKTWSGAIGGTLGAMAVAGATAWCLPGTNIIALVGLGFVLSIAGQAGDLMESALKRRFDVKDASQIIPGHGGVMDRLDGFWAAALVAAIIGIGRGGVSAPATGLFIW